MKNQIDLQDLLGDSESFASAKVIVEKVLEEREKGRLITNAQVLSAYPHLHESLRHELNILDRIRQAMLAATRITSNSTMLPALAQVDPETPLDILDTSFDGVDSNIEPYFSLPGYLLQGEVIRGGQALVYQAFQESTGRKVAIKVMPGGQFASSNHRTRFEREARILASLDHENIVSILERARAPDGSFFFVMPFVEGIALDDYWKSQLPRTVEGCRDLVTLFYKITRAIEIAHAREVVHRDLKPSNIRVDLRGEPHILDFGLASSTFDGGCVLSDRTVTRTGQIIGSLPWASPEQAAGQSMHLDARSDIYSIGVMMYQAITGKFPYSLGGPIDEVLLRIRKQNPEPPTKCPNAWPGADRSLDLIVFKTLEKDPLRRHQSALNLSQDLQAWLSGDQKVACRKKAAGRWEFLLRALMVMALSAAALNYCWISRPKPHPTFFKLPTLSDSIGMNFIKISPGAFMMGSPSHESGRNPDEQQQYVTVDHSYLIASTETTQSQYQEVMQSNPSDPRWTGPNMPVQNVSMVQAMEFCRRLSKIDHANFRLPTEIEWEYACRANNAAPFPNAANPGENISSSENTGGQLQHVASRQPNVWGLFDMQGNVREWCTDYYRLSDCRSISSADILRTIRGGSAFVNFSKCRAASKTAAIPTFHSFDLGFASYAIRDQNNLRASGMTRHSHLYPWWHQ